MTSAPRSSSWNGRSTPTRSASRLLLMTASALGDRFGRTAPVRGLAWGCSRRPRRRARLAPGVGWLIAGARPYRGRRRGDRHAARRSALPERGLPARAARLGDGDLRRRDRPGGRRRPGHGGRHHRGDLVAVDLLGSTSRSPSSRSRSCSVASRRASGPPAGLRLRRPGARDGRGARARVGARCARENAAGWGSVEVGRDARGGRAWLTAAFVAWERARCARRCCRCGCSASRAFLRRANAAIFFLNGSMDRARCSSWRSSSRPALGQGAAPRRDATAALGPHPVCWSLPRAGALVNRLGERPADRRRPAPTGDGDGVARADRDPERRVCAADRADGALRLRLSRWRSPPPRSPS